MDKIDCCLHFGTLFFSLLPIFFSFSDVLTNDHPVGLVFGITFLIVLAIGREFSSPFNYFKHLRPASTGRRYCTFYTYPMYVRTKSGKRLRLTDNGVDSAIKDRIKAVCGDGKFRES
ncbi:MAG: hypothetical protein IJ723_07085 [Ruminococcus sp.]|nr:hypothetical protein [Ruminococcus sp.]